LTNEAEMAQW